MLPFVPRKVAKSFKWKTFPAAQTQSASEYFHTTSSANPLPHAPSVQPTLSSKGKAKDAQNSSPLGKDSISLLVLSLSEYALWANPDLRRAIETSEEGYIPLSYLVAESPYFNEQDSAPLESALVKAIRMYAAELIDVRMIMSEPSRAVWYGRRMASADVGGYEIRIKDVERVLGRAQQGSRRDWDSRTLYMENIPPQYRSIIGVYHFAVSLLQESSTQATRVQHISLPRHHQDKPEDRPKCKGFALVTFLNTEDVDKLLERWSWRREPGSPSFDNEERQSAEWSEAAKFGFRVLQKSKWEKLNKEYLAYRQRLLDEIAQEEAAVHAVHVSESAASEPEPEAPAIEDTRESLLVDPNATYPNNCLVFVRNIHPETNKTTLRKLFSQMFQASGAETSGEAIDYVDFNKGMNTCYLRLSSPLFAQHLVTYLAENTTAQMEGLDGDGSAPSGANKPISIEVVTGEREELYWGKVPEKIRRQAVAKASTGSNYQVDEKQSPVEAGFKRKRRRG